MAERYEDSGRERYRDPDRERVWGRGRRGDWYDEERRESRGEFLRENREWNNQFDRGDRERDHDRDRWREQRYGSERSEYGRPSREEWRGQDQGRSTGQNLGGGIGSYSTEDWRSRAHTGYGGGMGEGYSRERDWDRQRDERYREEADAYGLGGAYSGGTYRSYTGTGTGLRTWGSPERSGRYTGRGPKSYQRSDERIREDICERLTQHPEVDATEIDIQVNNGEVTLLGTVEERHEKRLAEDIVENVWGVRDVHNQVRVNRSLGQRMSEALGFGGRDREHEERRQLNVTGANPAYTEPTRK